MLLTPHVGVKIYVCAQLDDEFGVFGRHDLDGIVPGLDKYTVCNMYTVNDGLKFTRITPKSFHLRYMILK